jgi:hypothetical protein
LTFVYDFPQRYPIFTSPVSSLSHTGNCWKTVYSKDEGFVIW